MNAAEWKATLDRMIEGLEREVLAKREELAELENSLAGAHSMKRLPPSLLASALSSEPKDAEVTGAQQPGATISGRITLGGSLREAVAAQTGEFTNTSVFDLVNQKYPGVFTGEHIKNSVSSIMAKMYHKGLLRQVRASPGVATVWEKVPEKWVGGTQVA